MASREVLQTRKNSQGDILALCNPSQIWSPRAKSDAIRDIEIGLSTYFFPWFDGTTTQVHVVNGPTGKYLRTDKDQTTRNNLDDLPDC